MTKKLSVLSHMSRYRTRVLLVWLMALMGSLIALPSHAMPPMKRADFETVFAGESVTDECVLDEDYVSSVWDDELIRARIKQGFTNSESGWLWLTLQCFALEGRNDRYVFDIDVNWTWKVSDGEWPELPLGGTYGIGPATDVKSSVREVINSAITEYLKANL